LILEKGKVGWFLQSAKPRIIPVHYLGSSKMDMLNAASAAQKGEVDVDAVGAIAAKKLKESGIDGHDT
jgi:hypothetical protein